MTKTEAIEELAEAIYNAHLRTTSSGNNPPIWANTRNEMKEWSRKQASAALLRLEALGAKIEYGNLGVTS